MMSREGHICGNPNFDVFVCRSCHPDAPPIGSGDGTVKREWLTPKATLLSEKPKDVGLVKRTWFWLRFGERYHRHEFKQSGSAFFCQIGRCSAWYGEQNWPSGV